MKALLSTLLALATSGAVALAADEPAMNQPAAVAPAPAAEHHESIVMGGGCFWCLEAVFQRLKGVEKVVSGYEGGTVPNPTYHQVCDGTTGHAEVVRIDFDNTQLPLEKLLEVFWAAHDPTTLNRQGNDSGTQYRSVLFYSSDAQKEAMEKSKAAAQKDFKSPIVTQIVPSKDFYTAEGYHQNYYNQNADRNPYCAVVIRPKLTKLLQHGMIKE